MDCVLRQISENNNYNFKISKNNDKQSKAHYICWVVCPKGVSIEQDDETHLHSLFDAIGLTPVAVKLERKCLTVQLQRKLTIPWIIHQFTSAKTAENYADVTYGVNVASICYSNSSDVDILRQLIISQHLSELLKIGCSWSVPICGHSLSFQELIQICVEGGHLFTRPNHERLEANLRSCDQVQAIGENQWMVEFPSTLKIHGNLLQCWTLTRNSAIFHQLAILLDHTQTVIYNVVSSALSYQHQVTMAILKLLTQDSHLESRHRVVEVGAVKLSPPGASLSSLVESRRRYLLTSSEEKYGSVVHEGEFWKKRISELTLASLKFELMSRSPKQMAMLRIDGEDGSDIKTGSFVLYNCARLATLFKHYGERVRSGIYPQLCDISEADFSLLKTEDEWILVFHHLNVYPSMISELKNCVHEKTTLLNAQLTQTVRFLHSLSRDLSTYYSTTHILGESRDHLMPAMMSRLLLLQLIHKMLVECLRLLCIEPFESM